MAGSDNQIECPNCGQQINVADMLHQQIESQLKKQFGEERQKEKQQYADQLQQIENQRRELEQARQQQQAATDHAIEQGLKQRQAELEQQLKKTLRAEQEETLEGLNKELEEKTEQVRELHRTRAEMEKLKRDQVQMKEAIEAESEQRLNKLIEKEKERLNKTMEDRNRLDLAERDKVISDLNQQLKDAQRRAEQGSMQLQGEVQELAIEDWLRDQFPLDTIEEIKKGARGADCLQTVHTRNRQYCGKIYYESKRAKSFQPAWIEKFRQDIRDKGADIGVLVTESMPADMPRMGLRDGVWVCSFDEFRGLSLVLRESAIRMSNAVVAQENRGDKMGMLYDFLTGSEFQQQVEAIVEGFTTMKSDLESEKRSMQMIWKKREKQIDKVLLNTTHMYGSIKGIAGNAVQNIAMLDLDESGEEQQALPSDD